MKLPSPSDAIAPRAKFLVQLAQVRGLIGIGIDDLHVRELASHLLEVRTIGCICRSVSAGICLGREVQHRILDNSNWIHGYAVNLARS